MHRLYNLFTLAVLLLGALPLYAGPPDWEVDPEDFQYSASINATVIIDELPAISIGDRVALLVNDEVRGVSQPIPLGGSIFHFINVYSNLPMGEEMDILVYRALDDQVYPAFTTYTFTLQDVAGSFDKPFKIAVMTDGDFPITLAPLPGQTIFQGFPFAEIDLAPYLEQIDTDPVSWSTAPNPYLNATFNGSVLQITTIDPDWYGNTQLLIHVQEDGLNSYFAQGYISIRVGEAYLGPLWDVFVGESILPGQQFTNVLLEELEIQHEGDCREYNIEPILEIPASPTGRPDWQADIFSTPASMPIVARLQFTPQYYFNNELDLLGAFINGEVRGTAEPVIVNGEAFYFLQVYNDVPGAEISLKLYSAEYQDIYELPYTLIYNGIAGLGSIEMPISLDFSPYVFDLSGTSETTISPRNPDWQGAQSYTFTVADCNYPDVLLDQTAVTYCIGEDNDDDGFCNLIDPQPEDRCIPDYYPPALLLRNESGLSLEPEGLTAHDADQGDCIKSLQWLITAYELCEVPEIEAQISCEDAYVLPGASVELVDEGLDEFVFRLNIQAAVGINELRLTATDSDGNQSFFEYTIEVADTQAPNVVCQFATVLLDPNGDGILPAESVFDIALSQDNCGIEALQVNIENFNCNDLGNNNVVLTALDRAGNMSSCTATIQVEQSGELPADWSTSDIGIVTQGNDYFFDPCTAPNPEDGEFILTGSGNNATSSTSDNVAFASVVLCGDGSITAKVESVSNNGYGGVMIRESSDPGSRQVALFSNLSSVLRHEARYTPNSPKQVNSFFKPSPFWLKLERSGSWIFTYYSTTGYNFQYVHGVFLPLQECTEIGLASFTYLPDGQTDVVFSHVELSRDVGLVGGEVSFNNHQGIDTESSRLNEDVYPDFIIFPNPASDQFSLRFNAPVAAGTAILLIDQWGRMVDKKEIDKEILNLRWDTKTLNNGLYFIQTRFKDGKTSLQKLVISN